MDADGQHDPADIASLLKYMPDYDMVVGARSVRDQASVGRAIGNKLYNWLASYVAKFRIQDLTSGFQGYQVQDSNEPVISYPKHILIPDNSYIMRIEKRLGSKIYSDKDKTEKRWEKPHQDNKRRSEIFHDYNKNMHSLFPLENISSGELYHIHDRLFILHVYSV